MVMILKIPNISANVIGAVRKELLLLFFDFFENLIYNIYTR